MPDANGNPEQVVRDYYADISAGRFAEAAARLAPDATTWILGEGHWPLGGYHDLASLKQIHALVAERFPEGLQVTLKAMTVEGERDDICSVGQTVAAQDLCPNIRPYLKTHHIQTGVGHYGVFSGRKWNQQIYPRVRDHIHGAM